MRAGPSFELGYSYESGALPDRGVFDKSPSGPASSVRRLVIEATVTV